MSIRQTLSNRGLKDSEVITVERYNEHILSVVFKYLPTDLELKSTAVYIREGYPHFTYTVGAKEYQGKYLLLAVGVRHVKESRDGRWTTSQLTSQASILAENGEVLKSYAEINGNLTKVTHGFTSYILPDYRQLAVGTKLVYLTDIVPSTIKKDKELLSKVEKLHRYFSRKLLTDLPDGVQRGINVVEDRGSVVFFQYVVKTAVPNAPVILVEFSVLKERLVYSTTHRKTSRDSGILDKSVVTNLKVDFIAAKGDLKSGLLTDFRFSGEQEFKDKFQSNLLKSFLVAIRSTQN